jgi:hypothetical protein
MINVVMTTTPPALRRQNLKQPLAMQPRIMRLLLAKADMRVVISGQATRVGRDAAGAELAMTS